MSTNQQRSFELRPNQTSMAFYEFLSSVVMQCQRDFTKKALKTRIRLFEILDGSLPLAEKFRQELRQSLIRGQGDLPVTMISDQQVIDLFKQVYQLLCAVLGPIHADEIVDRGLSDIHYNPKLRNYSFNHWL